MVRRNREEVGARQKDPSARELAAGAFAVGLAVFGGIALRLYSRGKQTPPQPTGGWAELDLTTPVDYDSKSSG